MAKDELILQSHDLFTLLSDLTRLRCLFLIYKKVKLCVCELSHGLEISQPKVSRHLALLRKKKLVVTERKGLWVYYRIQPNLRRWMEEVLSSTFDNIEKTHPYCNDLKRLLIIDPINPVCKIPGNKMQSLEN